MPRTYDAAIRDAAAQYGDKIFLRADSQAGQMTEVSYAEFERRSRAVSAGLQAIGLIKGDRIAIAAPNEVEWLELFFGAVRAGLVVVTLNVRYRESELEYMLNQSGAKAVVSSAKLGDFDYEALYDVLQDRLPTVEHYFFLGGTGDGRRWTDLLGDPDAFVPVELNEDDPAVILYTSGTTGQPKGATLTHGSMLAAGDAQRTHTGYGADDRTVSLMPLNHVGGLTCALTVALLAGGEITMLPAFSPESALQAFETYRATQFGGVPTMWRLMIDHPNFQKYNTSHLRTAIIGGANADPTLCRQIVEGFPGVKLYNLYGLSESSGAAVMSANDDGIEDVAESIGIPISGVEAKIVDASGNTLAAGEAGELYLRTASVAAGYWEMPQQTADTFPGDRWLATGDIAEITSDGHIKLRGRSKEMYVQGGYNVYPVEVENLICSHPAVAMAAGIGIPDDVLGEVGRYFVLLQPGQSATVEEILQLCKDKLANYKVPRQVIFVDELPMTPSGKISKAALKTQS